MKLSISGRISLAIGILLFVFFVTNGVSFYLTSRIQDNAVELSHAAESHQRSALNLELSAGSLAERVFAAIASGEPTAVTRAAAARDALTEAKRAYLEIARAQVREVLAPRIEDTLAALDAAAAEALATADRVVQTHAALDRAIADAVAAAQPLTARPTKAAAASTERAQALEIYAAVEELDRAARGETSTRLDAALADLGTAIAKFRAGARSADQRAMLDRLEQAAAKVAPALAEVAEAESRKAQAADSFGARYQEAQALFTTTLEPLVVAAKDAAARNVDFWTQRSLIYILVMSGVGALIGIITAMFLTRRIVRPILEMKASADAIGKGILEHRIPVSSDDEIGQLATSFNRMAENRQQSEEALRDLAQRDPLTKLPNRTLFHRRLVESMDNAKRSSRMVAVHFLDLDHFKDINDTLGHPSGDTLLRLVAERLKGCARTTDTVSRLGGDEFAVIQTNLADFNGIAVLARRVIETLSKPFELDGERVFTGTSIGITVYPGDGNNPEAIIKNADLALYRAKQGGRNMFVLFNPDMNADVQARRALERDLRLALERNEFFLTYQPQVDLKSGHISGAEALVRWRHPERGLVSPGAFIPVAEQTGLIIHLTERVMRTACRQAKAWQAAGLPPIRVSVNLSPADFKRKNLIPVITGILEQTDLDPTFLELEITEGMVMEGVQSVIETLREINALGVELAIDDFGTGYSSMAYLKRFPVDRLKIDQTFVRDVLENKEDAGICRAIVKLGHSLGLRVIAEGVETAEQLNYLQEEDCDEIQGYYIAKPMVASEFAEFVANYQPETELRKSEIA